MRPEQIAGIRSLVDWVSSGWDDAARAADELLALPRDAWDRWLESHREARTMQLLYTLLDRAEAGTNPELVSFVMRHAPSIEVPSGAEDARPMLLTRAAEVQAALKGARSPG